MTIITLKAQPLYAQALADVAQIVRPTAEVISLSRAADALAVTAETAVELAVVGAHAQDLDGLDYLPILSNRKNLRHIVVVTHRQDARLLHLVRKLGIAGFVNARTAQFQHLQAAIRTVLSNRFYRSPSLHDVWRAVSRESHLQVLSRRERIVLAVLGTGVDNAEAAILLDVSEHTVRSHRANLMRKLSLPHKGELMRFAVKNHYTRITNDGIRYPGHESEISRTGLMGRADSAISEKRVPPRSGFQTDFF